MYLKALVKVFSASFIKTQPKNYTKKKTIINIFLLKRTSFLRLTNIFKLTLIFNTDFKFNQIFYIISLENSQSKKRTSSKFCQYQPSNLLLLAKCFSNLISNPLIFE